MYNLVTFLGKIVGTISVVPAIDSRIIIENPDTKEDETYLVEEIQYHVFPNSEFHDVKIIVRPECELPHP